MDTLIQDVRFGFRQLLKAPGFTAIAILSLALGIGANTAIFSLVNTVLFRPFPVRNSHELVSVSVKGKNDSVQAFSYPTYKDFRDRNDVFSGLYLTRIVVMSLSLGGSNVRIWGNLASGNYFEVLGVKAIAGRTFTPEDDKNKLGHPVAVISYGCWQRRFGGDPAAIGRDILINNHSFKIIGVAPDGFKGTDVIYSPEVWVPMMMQPWMEPGNSWLDDRGTQNCFAIGRLKPGVTRRQAEASLNALAQQLAKEYPNEEEGKTVELIPPGFIISTFRSAIVSFSAVLMVAVALVLLIACVNLASLLLARATDRRREVAVRLAIGASRWRIIRQLLTENTLLALAGGVFGVMLAAWLIDLVLAFKPPIDIPLGIDLALDWRVIGFSVLASLLTGLFFGLAPALQATSPDLVPALKDATRAAGFRRSRLRSTLVVAQLALSAVLLVAAGLVVRALQQVQTLNPGFETEHGLLMSFDLSLQGYDQARGEQFQRQLIERIQALPGVRAAAITDLFPLSINNSNNNFFVEGQPSERGANVPTAMVASVSANYLTTMNIPLLAGRDFSEQDTDKSTPVVIVNEAFVNRFLPGLQSLQQAIGKRISTRGPEGPWRQIAGVTKTGKYWTLSEAPQPFVYFPLRQSPNISWNTLVVRTVSDPLPLAGAIRSEFQKLDPGLPVVDVKTIRQHLGLSLYPARVAAGLLGSFGLLALVLAATGIYGVMAYSVSQRTREIGIRMALGANKNDVLQMVVRQGMTLMLIGLGIGLVCAVAVTRLMASVLYGISSTDVVAFAAVTLLLVLVVFVACYIPARRAAKVDPMVALRYE
ncbi:MAG TPA: ABC transporter permease [Blastocatellia bacterium]|nr:ABC transporter permease [Blastocatellia bacterium]